MDKKTNKELLKDLQQFKDDTNKALKACDELYNRIQKEEKNNSNRGFLITQIKAEVSDDKYDAIDHCMPMGLKYKEGRIIIDLKSTGDVSYVDREDLLDAFLKQTDIDEKIKL